MANCSMSYVWTGAACTTAQAVLPLILKNIMERLRIDSECELEEVPMPFKIFDLICGASTGGIIALMLGCLRMSIVRR